MVLLLAALVLTGAAWLRSAEYDEQYTLFLTAGTPRPDWPETPFPAGMIATVQAGHATLGGIARDLRATDVHPPFYFWAVSLWRTAFGPTLFTVRMLSVLCGLVSLSLIGAIARRCAIPSAMPMLLTLGCYGFVYTNAIARGFALAEMLTLGGVALLLGGRRFLAGVSLGAACCCNYLAIFVAAAVIAMTGAWTAMLAAAPFLVLDAWFFTAQHAARQDQFPPFAIWSSLLRLAKYQAASVFGGVPLYADGAGQIAVGAIVGLVSVGVVLRVAVARPLEPDRLRLTRIADQPWRRSVSRRMFRGRFTSEADAPDASTSNDRALSANPTTRLLVAATVATPIGLLLLGAVFNNTPIELRYLSFGVPFIALLITWASMPRRGLHRRTHHLADHDWAGLSRHFLPRRGKTWTSGVIHSRLLPGLGTSKVSPRCIRVGLSSRLVVPLLLPLVIMIQSASIVGLLLSSRSAQPARATAIEAARLLGDGIVLLPRGNDSVGIVGAFGIEAPPSLPILLVSPTDVITDRIAPYHRVVVAMMAQDRDSIATIAFLRGMFVPPNWRAVAIGSNLEVFERADKGK